MPILHELFLTYSSVPFKNPCHICKVVCTEIPLKHTFHCVLTREQPWSSVICWPFPQEPAMGVAALALLQNGRNFNLKIYDQELVIKQTHKSFFKTILHSQRFIPNEPKWIPEVKLGSSYRSEEGTPSSPVSYQPIHVLQPCNPWCGATKSGSAQTPPPAPPALPR